MLQLLSATFLTEQTVEFGERKVVVTAVVFVVFVVFVAVVG